METPSAETLQVLEWVRAEINAGKSLRSDEQAKIWNGACDQSLRILASYEQGVGLFQIVSRRKSHG